MSALSRLSHTSYFRPRVKKVERPLTFIDLIRRKCPQAEIDRIRDVLETHTGHRHHTPPIESYVVTSTHPLVRLLNESMSLRFVKDVEASLVIGKMGEDVSSSDDITIQYDRGFILIANDQKINLAWYIHDVSHILITFALHREHDVVDIGTTTPRLVHRWQLPNLGLGEIGGEASEVEFEIRDEEEELAACLGVIIGLVMGISQQVENFMYAWYSGVNEGLFQLVKMGVLEYVDGDSVIQLGPMFFEAMDRIRRLSGGEC